jgi:AcrR family transcriptional regulator
MNDAAGAIGLRADARLNRARILEAASAVFAEKGRTASTEEVAARAGVAIGTVFRHFPTKDALLREIMKDVLLRLWREAESLRISGDPGTSLHIFFRHVVDQAAHTKTVVDLLAAGDLGFAVGDTASLLHREVHALLLRAQQAGTVRANVRTDEVLALLASMCMGALHGGWTDDLRRRAISIVFDGLE